MKKRFLSMLVLLAAVATGAWADTTVTWTTSDISSGLFVDFVDGTVINNTIKGITATGSIGGDGNWSGTDIYSGDANNTITFTSSVGNIKSIEIKADQINFHSGIPAGWTLSPKTLSWSGEASSTVSLTFSSWDGITNISEIVFTIESSTPAASTYSVTLAEGTEEADKWTIEPNTGLKGGETVTATYSGTKKVKSVKAVKKEADPLAVPMTIEAITEGQIRVRSPKEGMQYSLNGGAKTPMSLITTTIDVAAGDKVAFYGNGTSITSYGGSSSSESTRITGNGDGFTCKVYGNIMSLVDEENFATAKTLSAEYAFSNLFYSNTTLTDASGLLLPATQLAANCYERMFSSCTALTAAPALPATQLAASCYYYMFFRCSALTAAPELPATQLAAYCYSYMFRDCTSLTAAPALPATQLAEDCYNQMFRSCTALTTAPELPAPTLVDRCYYQMFFSCSNLAIVTCRATSGINQASSTAKWLQSAGTQVQDAKFVYTVSTANWPTNVNGIPSGWERVNVDN